MLLGITLLAFSSFAYSNSTLIKERGCLSCHKTEKKFIGPPLKAIAIRYSNENIQYVKKILTERIQNGSKGHWGNLPMPAQVKVTEEEIEKLIMWILKLSVE